MQSGDTKVVVERVETSGPYPSRSSRVAQVVVPQEGGELAIGIGRNELDVIQVCLAYVDAQREYYVRNPMNVTLLQYRPSS